MRNMPEVSQMVVTLVSVSCAKFRSEEYMVTSGPTNHLDFLMRSDMVIAVLSSKSPFHFTIHAALSQEFILTAYFKIFCKLSLDAHEVTFHQEKVVSASIMVWYHFSDVV